MSFAKGGSKSFGGVRQNPPSPYLLDAVPNATKSISVARKLRLAYSGDALEIRESGGNTLGNIGFSGINFDDAAFSAFIGANNGFIRRFYDQSGNSLDVLQATNASQAQQRLNRINSRPAALTIALKDYTFTSQSMGTTYDLFLVVSFGGNNNNFVGGGKGSPENNAFYTTSTLVAHEAGGIFNSFAHAINKSNFHTIHVRRIGHETIALIVDNILIEYFRLSSNLSLVIANLFSSDPTFNGALEFVEDTNYTRSPSAGEVQIALDNLSSYYGITPASPYITANYLKLLAADIGITPRDGMQATFDPPQTVANGNVAVVHTWGGWVAEDTPQTKAQHFKSIDGGVSFTAQTVPPFTRRHVFGALYKDVLHWILGGDAYVPKRDVWTYNSATDAYTELTSDWGNAGGSSDRDGSAFCLHQNKIIMVGGQDAVSGTITMNTTCMQFNETTNQMDLLGTIGPTPGASFWAIVDFNGDLYTMGGGKYEGPPYTNMNANVHKSIDHGVTWTFHATLPAGLRTMFCSAWVMKGRVFLLLGADINGNNVKGIWSTSNLIDWVLEPSPDARHAAGVCVDTVNTRALIFAGNKGGTPAGNKDGFEFG